MGKPTGFLDYTRPEDPFRPAEKRLCDFGINLNDDSLF